MSTECAGIGPRKQMTLLSHQEGHPNTSSFGAAVSIDRLADTCDAENDEEPAKNNWPATFQLVLITLAEQAPSILLAIAYLAGHH